MTPNTALEIKVIQRYIDKTKQDRFITYISSPKKRYKFTAELAHFNYFKRDLFTEVVGSIEQTILQTLQNAGVSSELCYAISEDPELDAHTLDTVQAIREIVGRGNGTMLVFGDADILFFEGEGMKNRYISKLITSTIRQS